MESEFSGTSISECIKLISKNCNDSMELYEGKVIQADPIKIQLTADMKIILTKSELRIPETFRDHSVSATFNSVSGTLKINAGLKEGDKVMLLTFPHLNMHSIVIDRE